MLERERQIGAREQIEKQRVSLRVLATATPDVRVKRAALEEERQSRLIEQRQMIVAQVFELDESVQQRVRHHDVAEAQGGEEDFAECAGVDQAPACVEALQARQWGSAVAQL